MQLEAKVKNSGEFAINGDPNLLVNLNFIYIYICVCVCVYVCVWTRVNLRTPRIIGRYEFSRFADKYFETKIELKCNSKG